MVLSLEVIAQLFREDTRRIMGISVRKANVDDYSFLCELFDEVDALHRDHLPHIFQKPDGAVREHDYYLGMISDEDTALFVAERGGKLVGFICAVIRDAPDFPVYVPRCYLMVDGIGVKSGFQNQGIGRMLMERMEVWASAKGATSIELNVYDFNETAISFYEGLGFHSLSRKMSKDPKGDQAAD